jgi:hypothetical protein
MFRAAWLLGLAGLCLSAADNKPDVLLTRLRERIAAGLERMPNYTCVETITRRYFKPDAATRRLQSWSLDRLRIEVATTPSHEIYSWAGAHRFEDRDLTEIVTGPIGTGAFSEFLSGIFIRDGAEFAYVGEAQSNGRAALEFAYRVRQEKSRYLIRARDGWITAGHEGRFLVDRDTVDLLRLSIAAQDLPEATGASRIETELEYQALLPRSTVQRFVLRSGMESENTTAFSACREYRGESILTYPQEGATAADSHSEDNPESGPSPLPPDLRVAMALAEPLDTWSAAGGDVIALRLTKPIVDSAKRVLVPAGAAIEARLLRVQRFFTKPGRVTLVIRPERIDRQGARLPFAVLPTRKPAPLVRVVSFRDTEDIESVAQFDFVGDHVVLPKGYPTIWRTAAAEITPSSPASTPPHRPPFPPNDAASATAPESLTPPAGSPRNPTRRAPGLSRPDDSGSS